MPIFLAAYVAHLLRMAVVAVVMLALGVSAWFLAGIIIRGAGTPSPTTALVASLLAAGVGLGAGGFISASRIAPGSLLHPLVAAAALGTAFAALFASDDLGDLVPIFILAPCVPALFGALLACASRPGLLGLLACLLIGGSLDAEEILSADMLLDFLRHDRPSTRWDAASTVAADFNGDGRLDMAALGAEGSGIVLAAAVRADGTYMAVQYLSFAVGGEAQAAVCATPVTLEAEPLLCEVDGRTLPGCVANPRASGLALSDDDCDAVHLYWDHEKAAMAWWRR
jgi:hypothetical protein